MTLVEFLRWTMRYQHNMSDLAVRDLTPEQVQWRPPGSAANHIGFTLFHYVRTEDIAVHAILQGEKDTVWASGGYGERWDLDRIVQGTGTGLSAEAAGVVRLPAMHEWIAYQQDVWRATDAFLASTTDGALEETREAGSLGEMPARQALAIMLLHGNAHLGEINLLRVLMGLSSRYDAQEMQQGTL